MSLFSVPTGQAAAPEAAGMKADVPSGTFFQPRVRLGRASTAD